MIHALQTALVLAFPVLVILGGLRDAASYTIPNWISVALAGAFFVAALAAGLPPAAVGLHVAVGAVALALGVVLFALGWIGGGDAKLFAAAALWLGWPALAGYLAWTSLAGGALAILLLTMRSAAVRPLLTGGPGWFRRLATPGENVPYGVAIAVGALAAFAGSPLAAG